MQYGELGVLLLELGGAVVWVVLLLTLKLLEQRVVIGSGETIVHEGRMYALLISLEICYVMDFSCQKYETFILYTYMYMHIVLCYAMITSYTHIYMCTCTCSYAAITTGKYYLTEITLQ